MKTRKLTLEDLENLPVVCYRSNRKYEIIQKIEDQLCYKDFNRNLGFIGFSGGTVKWALENLEIELEELEVTRFYEYIGLGNWYSDDNEFKFDGLVISSGTYYSHARMPAGRWVDLDKDCNLINSSWAINETI